VRVLHVTEAAGGGVRRHLGYLVPALAEAGVRQSVVVSLRRAETGMSEELDRWQALGCAVHCLPMRRGLALRDVGDVLSLRRLIRQESPDVVHAHATKAGLLARLARSRGVPVVYSPHSFVFQDMAGVARRLAVGMERFLARRTSRFVFVSPAEAEVARRELGVNPEACRVVPNGLPTDWADRLRPRAEVRCEWGAAAGAAVLVVPARLVPQKGHDWLFRALAALSPPPGTLQVRLMGGGPMAPALQRLAEQLGIAPLLVWDGYVPDAGDLLAGADLVCLPSRHEGLSYALLETLAAGVPLVLSDVPGNVPDPGIRQVARFVPLGDVSALAEALRAFLADPGPWRERAQGGPELVRRHWSLERQVAGLVRCYREL
jgi:glycosyltransferase involved in cell wall biosynthesis